MDNLQVLKKRATLYQMLSIIKKWNKYYCATFLVLFICNCNIPTNKHNLDIDIRSCNSYELKKNKFDLRIIENSKRSIGRIRVKGFISDTIYFYTLKTKYVFFYQEKENKGLVGADCFIFSDSNLVYKVRISDQIAPDRKNYVSVFKYSDSICFNLEGKALYKKMENVISIKNFDVLNFLRTITAIDTTIFSNQKNGNSFNLTSYLQ